MTSPDENSINLAALWIPVMPETSNVGTGAREAGRTMRREFEAGVNEGSSNSSAGKLGETLAGQIATGFNKGMGKLELPAGLSNVTEGLMRGFEGMKQRSEAASESMERLEEAEGRLTDAQEKLGIAVSRFNDLQSQSSMTRTQYLTASASLARAFREEHDATEGVSEAHENYTGAVERSKGSVMSFASETGVLAGVVAGTIPLVGQFADGIIEFADEAVEKGIETTHELGEQLVEIAEKYHDLGIQITEYSGATGEAFDNLEEHAASVFSQLDVSGADTGKTMSQLASYLDAEASPALDTLTKHVEDLKGRYTDLDTQKVATDFKALGVNIDQADNTLASWLQSSKSAGIGLDDLTNSLSQVADTLRPEISGLNADQLGAWMAQVEQKVPNASKAIMGLSAAEKSFAAQNMTFSQGMAEAAKELTSSDYTDAQKQGLAETLFGTRKWQDALTMVQQYQEVLDQGPAKYAANGTAIDDFTRRTEDLGNKWEEVKHKVEAALLPMGEMLLSKIEGALDGAEEYIQEHSTQITKWVKEIGDAFIGLLPDVQSFAEGFLAVLSPVAQGFEDFIMGVMGEIESFTELVTAFLDAVPEPIAKLIPGFDAVKSGLHGMESGSQAAIDAMKKMGPVGDVIDGINDKIKGLHISVPQLTDDFNDLVDKTSAGLSGAANGVQLSPTAAAAASGGAGVGWSSPGAENSAGQTGGSPVKPGATSNKQLAQQMFPQYFAASEWGAFDKLEMSEAGYDNTIDGAPQAGGHPAAHGIGQFLDSTFAAYGGRTDDPQKQLDQMFRYIKDKYGTPTAAWAFHQANNYYGQGGGPKGTDTVPAWLTPGEYVWSKPAMDKWGWLIPHLNDDAVYRAGGGPIDTAGAQVDTIAVAEAVNSLFPGIASFGLYRAPDGYNEHSSGEAVDISPGGIGTPASGAALSTGTAISDYVLQNAQQFGVEYTIWQNKLWYPDGHSEPYGQDPSNTTQAHMDHVHVRTAGGGYPSGGGPGSAGTGGGTHTGSTSSTPAPAAASLGSGGSFPSASGGGAFGGPTGGPGSVSTGRVPVAGLPGQYGGLGAYGGETADEQYSTQKAVDDANRAKTKLEEDITKLQTETNEAKKKLDDAQALPPLMQKPDQIQSLTDAYTNKQQELNDKIGQRSEIEGNITEAQRKQQEAYYKAPSGAAQEYKIPGLSEFSQLGSGLTKGISEELGFGDIFKTPPWEWGIVKLLGGLGSWGLGTANAWADEIGKGHTGMTGFSPIPGFETQKGAAALSGMLGNFAPGLGNLLPQPQMVNQFGQPITTSYGGVGTGPNIVPGSGIPLGSPASGQGSGTAPGPVTNNNVTVTGQAVEPQKIATVVTNQMSTAAFQQSGGTPK